jgi:peptidoglycan L-alanyl-D-glutamate endopeptidase CwlK
MSYELRHKSKQLLQSLLPSGKKKIVNAMQFAENMHQAASPEKLQSHWHLQQWWILIAGFFIYKYSHFCVYTPDQFHTN